jgi:putative hemolysin
VNFLFTQWKKLLSKIFKSKNEHTVTQDELLMMVDEASQAGDINEDEGELLRSAIEFNDLCAEDILTPRVDLETVPSTATKEEVAKVFSESRYSRLLVIEDGIDDIVGVIHQKDFYCGTGVTDQPLTEVMSVPIFVPENIKIGRLLKLLQTNKSHIAVVSDEYGGTVGIVTMEDILEELVGEIWDEHDEVVVPFEKIGENTYRVVCTEDLDKMEEFFDIECESDCTSISGWVMEQLGRIPREGDRFTYDDMEVVVTETDAHRVIEVEITRHPKEEDEEEK